MYLIQNSPPGSGTFVTVCRISRGWGKGSGGRTLLFSEGLQSSPSCFSGMLMADDALLAECKCWFSGGTPHCWVPWWDLWFQTSLFPWPPFATGDGSLGCCLVWWFWPRYFLCIRMHRKVLLLIPGRASADPILALLSALIIFSLGHIPLLRPLGSRYARPLSKQLLSREWNGSAPYLYTLAFLKNLGTPCHPPLTYIYSEQEDTNFVKLLF